MKEVEVKARIKDKAEMIAKLEALGCKFSEPIIQKDTIFVPLHVMKVPTDVGVPVLRIREQNGKYTLTMKIRLTNGLDKQESETDIMDPVAMKEIILSSGFKQTVSFQKTRQKTKYKNWEVCVDEIEGLGYYMETEELSEDCDSAAMQANMFAFMQTLGVEKTDLEDFGYDVIIWRQQQK
jgi:adenylate cyclase class 2